MNCFVLPAPTVGFVGVTAIDCSSAAVTVKFVVPLIEFCKAVMVIGPPSATPFASPWLPAALLMVSIVAFDEDQVTAAVRSWVLLSE